jgi:hypothetical protein
MIRAETDYSVPRQSLLQNKSVDDRVQKRGNPAFDHHGASRLEKSPSMKRVQILLGSSFS